jgi:deoxyribodipyrimidine photolyase-related protein
MRTVAFVYPHHLYAEQPAVNGAEAVWLIEEPLFFTQYNFHAQKLMYHRATMQCYRAEHVPQAQYIESTALATTGDAVRMAKAAGYSQIRTLDPNDDWLQQRLQTACQAHGVELRIIEDPHFCTPTSILSEWHQDRPRLQFSEFYKQQRTRLNILMNDDGPAGERWSFDTENRKRLPAGFHIPHLRWPAANAYTREAQVYVQHCFPRAPGSHALCQYPISSREAQAWLRDFLDQRFAHFGTYEDAISIQHPVLFHSVLTPILNTGLLTPKYVLEQALTYADRVPMNALEGFVRQIIGWREYIRLAYHRHGRTQRSQNFWKFTHAMPQAFYDGTTGLAPVDRVIGSVHSTAYCHHIERLMILGNAMLLCRIHPDHVYRWFMEMFIDAYDWVMVPNVYGMSQYADGGSMTTKPYLSGSAYVLRMSNEPRGSWCNTWDALYWTFIADHRPVFASNHRLSMMAHLADRLGPKLLEHRKTADAFLSQLHR